MATTMFIQSDENMRNISGKLSPVVYITPSYQIMFLKILPKKYVYFDNSQKERPNVWMDSPYR